MCHSASQEIHLLGSIRGCVVCSCLHTAHLSGPLGPPELEEPKRPPPEYTKSLKPLVRSDLVAWLLMCQLLHCLLVGKRVCLPDLTGQRISWVLL